MIKGIIFDYNRTLYDPDSNSLTNGALELLDNLREKNYKMCLVSKGISSTRREEINALGIIDYFLEIIVTEGEKDPGAFSYCLEKMKLPAKKVAVVGDRVNSEIRVGNTLGMRTIWYRKGKFSEEMPKDVMSSPDRTIYSLDDVIDTIKSI